MPFACMTWIVEKTSSIRWCFLQGLIRRVEKCQFSLRWEPRCWDVGSEIPSSGRHPQGGKGSRSKRSSISQKPRAIITHN